MGIKGTEIQIKSGPRRSVDINRHVQERATVSINTQMHRGRTKYVDFDNVDTAGVGVQKSDGSWMEAAMQS